MTRDEMLMQSLIAEMQSLLMGAEAAREVDEARKAAYTKLAKDLSDISDKMEALARRPVMIALGGSAYTRNQKEHTCPYKTEPTI